MKKAILCCVFGICLASTNSEIVTQASSAPLVGGCGAPLFFKSYDAKQLNEIPTTAKSIQISYPVQLHVLANKIYNNLKLTHSAQIYKKQVDLKDTDTIKYRHDAVIVVACFR